MPAARTKLLASWDASKQETYRKTHAAEVFTFTFLLDESPSMAGEDAVNLRNAFNRYLAWLQRHADPMGLAEVRCFSTALGPSRLTALGSLQPLTPHTYDPLRGDGTALYRAIGDTCTTTPGDGPHVLVVFTDGNDNASEQFAWTYQKVATLLATLQTEHEWLCVFLGAFPDALSIGRLMGFQPGNCLAFTADKIPEAFHALTKATQLYLEAAPHTRKLLAAGGVF